MPGFKSLGPGTAAFIAVEEEEYADAFRQHGWGEHAIEMELERLRAFKQGRDPLHLPSTRQALQDFINPAGKQSTKVEEPETPLDNLSAAVKRTIERRLRLTREQEAEDKRE